MITISFTEIKFTSTEYFYCNVEESNTLILVGKVSLLTWGFILFLQGVPSVLGAGEPIFYGCYYIGSMFDQAFTRSNDYHWLRHQQSKVKSSDKPFGFGRLISAYKTTQCIEMKNITFNKMFTICFYLDFYMLCF